MIETVKLTKTYRNGFCAVKGLDLNVDKGDVFGFLGPNGAGKTTTIRMLDGLLCPTSGRAFVDGMDITRQPEKIRSIIGVVPESHGYYYWMTAKEYLKYFNCLYGSPAKDSYIDVLLERVGLSERKDVTVGQFSRGMKQRLGIAKALINRPKVIFLDEPTLGLDPRGQREIQQLLLEISQTDGTTVFITSHLLKDIEVLCNRVCIVKDGAMAEQGSIEELSARYLPNYTMLLRTTNDNAVLELAKAIPGVCAASVGADGISAELCGDDINAVKHRLVTAVITANIDILEMSRRSLSMEDIFFKATETEDKK